MNDSKIGRAALEGFVDGRGVHRSSYSPLLIDNQGGFTMSRAITAELRTAEEFVFSVAFITPGALNVLKQDLLDFKGRGTVITSNYLGFNSPATYKELLNFSNLEVMVVDAKHGFHAKGYVFRRRAQTTAIVGSSNLTVSALASNQEWNFRFSAEDRGDVVAQIEEAILRQRGIAEPIDAAWAERFARTYEPWQPTGWLDRRATQLLALKPPALDINEETARRFYETPVVRPNKMQESALASLSSLRADGESKALVVSATGTGKTILAALDVREFAPKRMLFLAHREQILDKAIEEFRLVLGLPKLACGKLSGSSRELGADYLFATTQSFTRAIVEEQVSPEDFDYVIVDEVHRAGAPTYKDIVGYLRPRFMLGMTATPERTDGFNVFELFDHNLAYEIRLQEALEESMLVPFHYFGVTDYTTSDGRTSDELSDLTQLTSAERVDYLVQKLEQYGQVCVEPRGLIFCSRNEEARELSVLLNMRKLHGAPLRTKAVSGEDSIAHRESVVAELESGKLDYVLSVDVFNEGIDIPSLNQIVMMRQTQSSIVFTQQLGRGLRKHPRKEYLVVVDFIGNYANNFLIPTALFGDASNNKEQLRRRMIGANGDHVVAGVASINFDQIARERVFAAMSKAKLDALANLKRVYLELGNRLGRRPMLLDFVKHKASDAVVVGSKYGSYHDFLRRAKGPFELPALAADQVEVLRFLSSELLNGKRPHELLLLLELVKGGRPVRSEAFRRLLHGQAVAASAGELESVERVLNLQWFTASERKKYGSQPIVRFDGTCYHLAPRWCAAWAASPTFREFALDVIAAGLQLSRDRYGFASGLVRGERYSRKDMCRLLNWQQNEEGTVFGYKVDKGSSTCPIFVTYHKSDDVSESTKYEDRFIDQQTLHWYTKSRRTLTSGDVKPIVEGAASCHLFVKKDDAEGIDFIYLGAVEPSGAVQTTMPGKHGKPLPVVTMNLELQAPVDGPTYDYLTGAGWR